MIALNKIYKILLGLIITSSSVMVLAKSGNEMTDKIEEALSNDSRIIAQKAQLEKGSKCAEQKFTDMFPIVVADIKEKLKIAKECHDTGRCVDEIKDVPKSELKEWIRDGIPYFNSLNPKFSILIDTQLNCDGLPGKRGISARLGLVLENDKVISVEVLEVETFGVGKAKK